jgi:hypothetical protein
MNKKHDIEANYFPLNSFVPFRFRVKWVPYHHGMARRHVADGGEGRQIWRVTANILNKQSRTADKGWPSSLGVGRGLTTPHREKTVRYEMLQRASDFDGCFGTT